MKTNIVAKTSVPTLDVEYDEANYLYIGAGGNIIVTEPGGADVTYVGLTAGIWHPIITKKIVTGTTAADIKVGY